MLRNNNTNAANEMNPGSNFPHGCLHVLSR